MLFLLYTLLKESFLHACLSVKWYWQSLFHSSRSSVRAPRSGHTWPRLTRSLPSDRHCMMFNCRLAGRSVSVMPVDVGWKEQRAEEVMSVVEICISLIPQMWELLWVCMLGRCRPCWSGCCPAAAATAWCSPCGAPRCWCSPPGRTCPCLEPDHTVRCRASEAALLWDERSAGRRELVGRGGRYKSS